MEEARKKKWASVALIIGAIGFIIIMIYFTVISIPGHKGCIRMIFD